MKFLLIIVLLLPVTLSAQMSGKVSKYLSWAEATITSHKGISNTPSPLQQLRIKAFGAQFFDKLRERVGSPLYVSSLYRSPELNRAVKGAKNSDHQILGDVVACDIDQDGKGKVVNRALFFILMHEFPYFKIIWEFGDNRNPAWVHISWSSDPAKNKLKKTYRAVKRGNRTVYLDFSTSGI